tara:strand:+ start:314 stop:460 length:147 start_codon:yes stop_codon:yes gene_type:complete
LIGNVKVFSFCEMPLDIVYQKKIEGLAPIISFYSLIKMDDSQTTGWDI